MTHAAAAYHGPPRQANDFGQLIRASPPPASSKIILGDREWYSCRNAVRISDNVSATVGATVDRLRSVVQAVGLCPHASCVVNRRLQLYPTAKFRWQCAGEGLPQTFLKLKFLLSLVSSHHSSWSKTFEVFPFYCHVVTILYRFCCP